MVGTMEQKVSRYLDIRTAMGELETMKKELSGEFKSGFQTMGVESMSILVGGRDIQMKLVTRVTPKCSDWETFRKMYPEIFANFFEETESSYIDVRDITKKTAKKRSSVTSNITVAITDGKKKAA